MREDFVDLGTRVYVVAGAVGQRVVAAHTLGPSLNHRAGRPRLAPRDLALS